MNRKLITADTHLTPLPQVFLEMPERLLRHSHFLMRYERREDGEYILFPERQATMQLNEAGMLPTALKIEDGRHLARVVNFACDFEDSFPGFTPEDRLPDMEREGVVGQVLIGSPEFNTTRSPEVTEAQILYCRLANDWLADTYKDYLDQFAPGIHLPWLDVAASVKELDRAAAMGLRPGVLPDGVWDSPYWRPEWEPLWEAAAGLRIPLLMHISGIRNPPPMPGAPSSPRYDGDSIEGFYEQSCTMGRTPISLALSGVFERYPDLCVVMTEGYAFWLAGMIEFVDHHYQGNFSKMLPLERKLKELPGTYIKRQAKATFMWDPVAIANRGLSGTEAIMWGNDYPHAEGVFPDSQAFVEKQFAGVPEAEIEKMTFSTARDLYGFKV
jgi:predicted TIM-barrel fold metal-dependent hydrolase